MSQNTVVITLRDITSENWREVTRLKLGEGQEHFVAPNWYSIIQSHFEGGVAKAIYADEIVVGFTWYLLLEDKRHAYINRLMTGLEYQGKGYGRGAMALIIADCKAQPFVDTILISFEPENAVARKLYESLGFEDTGELDEDEMVFKMTVTR